MKVYFENALGKEREIGESQTKGKGGINLYEPAIKWSGSKRSQAENIIKNFPKNINTYYEPFCGGASVLNRLLDSDISVQHYICSDLNNELIELWKLIQTKPEDVYSHYKKLWEEMNRTSDRNEKREFFYKVRKRLNEEKDPLDFMFIMRTTTNGMPRYNKKGEFNNSFHITRDGINPNKFEKIIKQWSKSLAENDVEFVCCSYESIIPDCGDFIYLDPPYANTKGMYYGALEYDILWEYLRNLKCGYALSFDGTSGEIDNTFAVPSDIYTKKETLLNGNSSFKRTIGKSNDSVVYENLYMKL